MTSPVLSQQQKRLTTGRLLTFSPGRLVCTRCSWQHCMQVRGRHWPSSDVCRGGNKHQHQLWFTSKSIINRHQLTTRGQKYYSSYEYEGLKSIKGSKKDAVPCVGSRLLPVSLCPCRQRSCDRSDSLCLVLRQWSESWPDGCCRGSPYWTHSEV